MTPAHDSRAPKCKEPGCRPGSSPRTPVARSGGFRRLGLRGHLRPVDELDERHRRVVALAESELEDAQVAARPRLVARTEFVEELGDDGAIAQAIEGEAAVGQRRLLSERDQRLRDTPQLLR